MHQIDVTKQMHQFAKYEDKAYLTVMLEEVQTDLQI